ncbi:MAG: tetratricopeptide repeat protein [Chloroflexota bacterium]
MKILTTLIILISALSLYAQEPSETFYRASREYAKGNYKKAYTLFKKIENTGYVSAEVYYNIGCCSYKLGKKAESILNFERAKKYKPNDDDISFNLRMANLRIIDRIDPLPQPLFVRVVRQALGYLSADAWSGLAIACAWIAAIFIALYYWSWKPREKKIYFFLAITAGLAVFITYGLAYWSYKELTDNSNAIVFWESALVKSAPDEFGSPLFELHEGSKLEILDSQGGWRKIKLLNGAQGWLREEALVRI